MINLLEHEGSMKSKDMRFSAFYRGEPHIKNKLCFWFTKLEGGASYKNSLIISAE